MTAPAAASDEGWGATAVGPLRAAVLLARMKGRLIRNGLGRRWSLALGFALGALTALALGGVGFAVLASARSGRPAVDAAAVMLVIALFAGWALLPVLAFESDDTLDPSRLALLPLRPTALMAGLLGASVVGAAPAGTAIALAGAVVGFSRSAAGAAVATLAVVLLLLQCITVSRAVTTGLSSILRTRRGRDAIALIAPFIGFTGFALQGLLTSVSSTEGAGPLLARVASTPPGLVAAALFDVRAGALRIALVRLAFATAWIGALGFAWWLALDRTLTTSEGGRSARGARRPSALFSGPLALLPRTRTGAVAARELRTLVRDPRRRAALVAPFAIILLAPAYARAGGPSPAAIAMPGLLMATVGFAMNQLGLTGRSLWLHAAAPHDTRSDLRGANLAVSVTVAVQAVVIVVLLALTGGSARTAGVTLVSVAVALGPLLGVANQVSVRFPIPVPEKGTNLWGGGGGGGTKALVHLGATLGALAVAAPAVALVVVPHVAGGGGWLLATAPAAAAYGWAVWRWCTDGAAAWWWWRQPEVLAAVQPDER